MSEQTTVTYNRAKGWQLALASLSSLAPTAVVIIMTFANYVAVGVYPFRKINTAWWMIA